MKPFLMGSETEFAVSGSQRGQSLSADTIYTRLFNQVCDKYRWFPDAQGGRSIYLGNGGRLYLDWNGHPEYATPECHTPAQVACHDKAAERLLLIARAGACAEDPDLDLTVLKTNLDPVHPDGITWGTHESYTCWASLDDAAPALIPHLVSRIVYAGSGCLSVRPESGGFELSQRSRHLVRAVGVDTTRDRPLFCTRLRKAADQGASGWTRLHLISKDSQRAPFGTYLTFGTTGLLVLLLNAGRKVGAGLELVDPVGAMRTISCDPWLRGVRVPLRDGRQLTALEIQESYLAECAREVQKGGFPNWAPEVLRHWEETLAALARDPLLLADRLDAYCKLRVYGHALRRAGFGWADLRTALGDLTALRAEYPAKVVRALLQNRPDYLPAEARAQYSEAATVIGADQPAGLRRLQLAGQLLALDVRYHELGGLYDRLASAGQVRYGLLTNQAIQEATEEAPPGGRAALRGRWIRCHPRRGWVCDWRYLYHIPTAQFVDLRDPFSGEPKTVSLGQPDSPSDPEVLQIFTRWNQNDPEPRCTIR
jgi:hypothetical protein